MRKLAVWISGRKCSHNEKSQHQGTEAGLSLVCSKNSKKTPGSVTAGSEERQKMRTKREGRAERARLLTAL